VTDSRYETAVPIGRGAIADVMRAHDPRLGRDVALKILRHDDSELAERMLAEARIQAGIDHPNVCQVYETGRLEDGRPFIAMQLIEGRTLDDAVRDAPPEFAVRLVAEAARAVHAAHRMGLIHRDLKPANIMVADDADGPARPYVLDFGLARYHDAPGMTQTGQILGTPSYMAPEQARGERLVDRRADVWALGAILYEALTGQRPFEADSTVQVLMRILDDEPASVRRLVPSLPMDLATIVHTCLEKNPDDRYTSAGDLADDLDRWLAGEPIAARPASVIDRVVRRARRHRTLVISGSLVVALALVGGAKYTLDVRAAAEEARIARDDAERLLDFMLEDLVERLEPMGQVEILGEVSRQALRHYDATEQQQLVPENRRRRARARGNLGKVLEAVGDIGGAVSNQRRFRDTMAELVAADPSRADWRLDLAEAEVLLGKALQEQGAVDEALSCYRRGLDHARAADSVDGAEARDMVWEAGANVGWALLEKAEFDAAEAALQEALVVARNGAEGDVTDREWRNRLSVTQSYLGFVDIDRTGFDLEAAEHFRQALAASRALAEDDPLNTRWQFEVGLCHGRLGFALESLGDLRPALDQFRRGQVVMEALVARDPANLRWLRELGVHSSSQAAMLRALGRHREAAAPARQSLAISRTIAESDPENASAQNDLAVDLVLNAEVLQELGRGAEAERHLDEALAIITPIADRIQAPYYRVTQVTALLRLGRVEEARPHIRGVLESGWGDATFVALCEANGIVVN
jgi:tetratricopeptide (TPR) repeat protein/predicted Ser/Thr protein kinase